MRRAAFPLMLVCAAAALFAPALCDAAPRVLKESFYAFPNGRPFRPRISGDWVVAVLNSRDNKSRLGIVACNVARKQTYSLYAGQTGMWPDVGGPLAVWPGDPRRVPALQQAMPNANPSSMICYDLACGRCFSPKLITGAMSSAVISGGYAAYEYGTGVFLLNLDTGDQQRIGGVSRNSGPEIGGDLVVWMESATNSMKDRQIRGYRISTGEAFDITNDGLDHRTPRTDGKTVVWWTDKGADIYDVATGKVFTIQGGVCPDVQNGIVVYERVYRPKTAKPAAGCGCGCGTWVVYGRDLKTGGEFRISKGASDQGPSIDDNRVIWCLNDKLYCAVLSRT